VGLHVISGQSGMTALMKAAASGHTEVIRLLAAMGADVACDDSGQTAIEHAVLGGNTECIAILQMYASDRALLLGN
jgi:ankyrin repeat protein